VILRLVLAALLAPFALQALIIAAERVAHVLGAWRFGIWIWPVTFAMPARVLRCLPRETRRRLVRRLVALPLPELGAPRLSPSPPLSGFAVIYWLRALVIWLDVEAKCPICGSTCEYWEIAIGESGALKRAACCLCQGRIAAGEPPIAMVTIRVRTAGTWPTADELQQRDQLEAALVAAGVFLDGHDCGAGSWQVCALVEQPNARAFLQVATLALNSLKLAERAAVVGLPSWFLQKDAPASGIGAQVRS